MRARRCALATAALISSAGLTGLWSSPAHAFGTAHLHDRAGDVSHCASGTRAKRDAIDITNWSVVDAGRNVNVHVHVKDLTLPTGTVPGGRGRDEFWFGWQHRDTVAEEFDFFLRSDGTVDNAEGGFADVRATASVAKDVLNIVIPRRRLPDTLGRLWVHAETLCGRSGYGTDDSIVRHWMRIRR